MPAFLLIRMIFVMKKIKTGRTTVTFEEGFNKYLDNCRRMNLQEETINYYKQSRKYKREILILNLQGFNCKYEYE